MKKTMQEEKVYLKSTLEKFNEIIEFADLRIESIPRMYKDNPDQIASLLSQYTRRKLLLEKTKNKPYFARIDFKNEEDVTSEECYIGKVGVVDDDNDIVTVDWRAPIASLYYDSNIGKATYEAPQGNIKGELTLKRQYEIENKELISFQDVDTVSNDEMLKPYLGANADNRLKNIVSTIQAEQNEIIREKLYKNLIIQGVAGSGKTTVALHRIAYLVYNNINNIKPEQYLVIGPNKFFVNYISGVLPDLDVDNVNQLTYDEIIKNLLKEDLILLNDEEKIIKSINNLEELSYEKLKVSLEFKDGIDKFLNDYDKRIVPEINLTIKGYDILSRNVIDSIYNSIVTDGVINYEISSKKVERTILLLEKYIEERKDNILTRIHNQYYEKTKNLTRTEIEKERKNIEFIEKELRNNFNQSLKKYFITSKPKILSLYIEFLTNINKYINNLSFEEQIKKNITNIKNKRIEFEDLGALLYLYYRIYGSLEFRNIKHTVIDESQDFGEFNFYALKKIMPNSTFSIFGDLAQSIYGYRGIENWNKIITNIFDSDCDIKYLKKSYRTTTEIMDSANNIIKHIGLTPSEPVIKHGVNVKYQEIDNNKIELISKIINKYLENKYVSIAIISKDEKEATQIYNELEKQNIKVTNITSSDLSYNGGICTITSYLAKGLEFDGVIITDASEDIYNSTKEIDMKLLYVAMTRALHELNILYNDKITRPLEKDL